jgi:Ca2+-binding EF-hand superfamily protein
MYSIKINNQKYFHPKEVQINKAEKTFQEIYVFEENTISNMFSQEQLNQAVADAVGQFDVNNDGMIGLQEAIHALQITAGAN